MKALFLSVALLLPVATQAQELPLSEISQIKNVKAKKNAFFSALYDPIMESNAEIIAEREMVQLYAKEVVAIDDNFKRLKTKYKVKDTAFDQEIDELLLKVDIIPLELALNQAANESEWGGSRFARTANNLFGIWCFKPGCGVVPLGRPRGEIYEVRKYDNIADSIKDYMYNLNVGSAYGDLRESRKSLRDSQSDIDSVILAEGLLAYSGRKEKYVEEIQSMIRYNKQIINSLHGIDIAKN